MRACADHADLSEPPALAHAPTAAVHALGDGRPPLVDDGEHQRAIRLIPHRDDHLPAPTGRLLAQEPHGVLRVGRVLGILAKLALLVAPRLELGLQPPLHLEGWPC